MAAYYTGWCVADWYNMAPPRVQPGDTILIHAGVYKEDWTVYGSDLNVKPIGEGAAFRGTYFLTQSGTPEKPIVIKAAGDGEVIFDGNGNFNLFNLLAADYQYFEGLTSAIPMSLSGRPQEYHRFQRINGQKVPV